MKRKIEMNYVFVAVVVLAVVVLVPGMLFATTEVTTKFREMADMVFNVARYIGIYGGLGGAIISLLFRYINKDQNIWSDALKIIGAGAALAAFSSILKIVAGWI
jgi:hypothetical protein